MVKTRGPVGYRLPVTLRILAEEGIKYGVQKVMEKYQPRGGGGSSTMMQEDRKGGRRREISSSYLRGKYRRVASMFRRGRGRRRRVLKKWISRRTKRQFSGFAFVHQSGGTVNDQKAVHIAFNNCPARLFFRAMIFVMGRQLFRKAGIDVTDDAAGIPNAGANLVFSMFWRQSPAASQVTSTRAGVANQRYFEFFDSIVNLLEGLVSLYTPNSVVDILQLQMPDGSIHQMYARDIVLDCIAKSALKMQNRSRNTTTDVDSTDIDRCPVNASVIQGRGTGPVPRDNFWSTDFYNDGNTALVALAGGTNQLLQTTLNPMTYVGARNYGRFTVNPGDIKTHIINQTFKVTFIQVLRSYMVNFFLDPSNMRVPFGQYKIVSFEKVIGNAADTSNTQDVSINYECEYKLWMGWKEPTKNYSRPINFATI